MGRGTRTQPKKMKRKLKAIRLNLGMSQQQMVKALHRHAPHEFLDSAYISQFERGLREPSLIVLLAYSKLSKISVNELIDDEIKGK
jgi:transcriptional regulator with XRE-family HTH domain